MPFRAGLVLLKVKHNWRKDAAESQAQGIKHHISYDTALVQYKIEKS
jgi:hypothetical protein